MRRAKVFMHGLHAGELVEDENGYHFKYASEYLVLPGPKPSV